jgi:class 3 adenylate cyclase
VSERHAERRIVTALFVDVVGSTALTRTLGPERIKRALDRAFAELAAVIEAEGGTVEKFAGDAVHAIFGAPVAHPDDPSRALRAAQACARRGSGQSSDAGALAVRIGVETGEAIVDLAAVESRREQMSVGTCVNVAARLQQLAEPGQVLVGPVCHEGAAEAAEFEALGTVELKGLGPLPVWRLVSVATPRARARVPFVGRDAELELLGLAFRRARAGRGVLALVSGPPGQGKTRLVDEFVAGLGAEARVLRARCRPAGELGARSPLRDLLGPSGAEISPETLAAYLAGLFPDATERHRVSTALSHSAGLLVSAELATLPAGQRQDEIANGWRRYLGAVARDGPILLWVEDLHWAEAELVLLLDRVTFGAEMPVLVVGTARPEFGEHAGLRPGGDRVFVTLDALDRDAARLLARSAGGLGASALERAEGNPLFIIELARARSLGSGPDVPMTLQGVIGARLDELALPDRELLQRAAVAGETFTARDAALLSGLDPVAVSRALDRLADLQYLHPVPAGHRFHHALVRDVAYGRLTTAERMQLHARYAREGVRADDAEALAHHLWEAVGPPDADWVWEGRAELPGLRADALAAHLDAARRSAQRFACERAGETCRRAVRFATGLLDTARVEQALAEVCAASGDADGAWTHYVRARDLHRNAGTVPPPDLYPGLLELPVYTSGMFRRLPEDALVETLLREGEAVARGAGDAASLARLLALHGYRSHDPTQLVEALRLSEEAGDPSALGSCLGHAAILQNRVGEFALARRIYERLDAMAAGRGLTDRQLEFRAILALNTGNLPDAERLAAEFLAASVSRGPHLRTHAYREQGHVLLARGDWRGLRDLAEAAERLVAEHSDTAFCYAVTTTRALSAVAHALEGRDQEARAMVQRAEAPLQAEPFERESVLVLAYGAVGAGEGVETLHRHVRQQGPPVLWFFHRMEAVALTMLERWDELDRVLRPLEDIVAKGSPYLEALVAAIREEMAAARGGPVPAHRRLVELGYLGWSWLLRHRPPPA